MMVGSQVLKLFLTLPRELSAPSNRVQNVTEELVVANLITGLGGETRSWGRQGGREGSVGAWRKSLVEKAARR